MDKKLDCEIVRDLLPSYVDGLTSETTSRKLRDHLSDCPDCSDALRRMEEPDPQKPATTVEVDYLKKVRRRARHTALFVGLALMLLGMALFSIRFFYVGSQAGVTDVRCHVSTNGNTVFLNGSLTASGLGVSRVTFSDSNGMVQCHIYTVPRTFFNSGDINASYTTSSPVVQVRIGDLILWEEGVEIDITTSRLFAAVNPFVGDMSANRRVSAALGIADQFGPFRNELQSSVEPYGWMLILDTPIASEEEGVAKDIMTADSYAMLAVVGNLGYVSWQYETDAGRQAFKVTAEEATAYAGSNIKGFADSASQLQTLMQSLRIKWAGVRETLQETGTFRIVIRNQSDDPIHGMGMTFSLDGTVMGNRGQVNADHTVLQKNGETSFEFLPADFPAGLPAIKLSGFSFDLTVQASDRTETVVRTGIPRPAKYGWTYFYTLTGTREDGFVLNEG